MENFGRTTEGGFLPSHPDVEGLLKQAGLLGQGWSGLDGEDNPAGHELQAARRSAKSDLLKNYVKTFSTPAGRKVLEDLLDQTLRREAVKLSGAPTMEQCMVYALQRSGQNALAVYILKMIQEGQDLDESPKKAKK